MSAGIGASPRVPAHSALGSEGLRGAGSLQGPSQATRTHPSSRCGAVNSVLSNFCKYENSFGNRFPNPAHASFLLAEHVSARGKVISRETDDRAEPPQATARITRGAKHQIQPAPALEVSTLKTCKRRTACNPHTQSSRGGDV